MIHTDNLDLETFSTIDIGWTPLCIIQNREFHWLNYLVTPVTTKEEPCYIFSGFL